MRSKSGIPFLIAMALVFSPLASTSACISNSPPMEISFINGNKSGELIALLRNTESGEVRQVYDDIGNISIHLALAHLHSQGGDSKKGTFDADRNKGTLQLLLSRLKVFSKTIVDYVEEPAKAKLVAKLKELETNVKNAKGTQKASDFTGPWLEMEGILYSADIGLTAKVKEPGQSEFGEDQFVSDIGLPALETSRSVGACNLSVGSFNTDIGAASGGASSGSVPGAAQPGTQ